MFVLLMVKNKIQTNISYIKSTCMWKVSLLNDKLQARPPPPAHIPHLFFFNPLNLERFHSTSAFE